MGVIYILLIFMVVGISLLYLIMCADPNKRNIPAMLNRLFYIRFPRLFNQLGPKLLGQKRVDTIVRWQNYFAYKNHPFFQIMYLLILVGGFILYMVKGFGEHFPNPRLSDYHYYMAYVVTAISLGAYYKACTTSPGVITKDNIDSYLRKYNRYEGVIYIENNACKTCNFAKPARSKHCRVCDCCVSKFDHHCVWIKQCVGEKNYKYFLLFLLTHVILASYAVFVGATIFYGIFKDQNLMDRTYRLGSSQEEIQATYFIACRYMFSRNAPFFFIVFLGFAMSVTLTLFLVYHCKLIADGTTTNEKIKKSNVAAYVKRQLKTIDERIKNEQNPENPEVKNRLEQEKRDFCKALDHVKNYFSKGFWKNLKEIINA